jgi:hypothetical protein
MGVSNQPFESSYFQRLREEWREETTAESLIAVLSARGLTLTEKQRARIEGCNDLTLLRRWLREAANASSVEEVID